MAEPKIAQQAPYVRALEPGTFWWCACGHSSKQPFCDGSHKGSSFVPVKLEQKSSGTVALCGCKHSKNAPFCDGSHGVL